MYFPWRESMQKTAKRPRMLIIINSWSMILFFSFVCESTIYIYTIELRYDLIVRGQRWPAVKMCFQWLARVLGGTLKYWFARWSWFNRQSNIESSSVRIYKQRSALKCTFIHRWKRALFLLVNIYHIFGIIAQS